MTIHELRKELASGPKLIRWEPSGIVEGAVLLPNGAVKIVNLISKKRFILPRREHHWVSVVPVQGLIRLGELLPKELRKND